VALARHLSPVPFPAVELAPFGISWHLQETCVPFQLSTFFSLAFLTAHAGGRYIPIRDRHCQNGHYQWPLIGRLTPVDVAPLTTARIKLAATCVTTKYSRGLLTVTSFFFTIHHCWWVRRLALLPVFSSFRSTLLPAFRGCRFRHYTELALHIASGKLAALCSFLRPHDQRRFHFAVPWSHLQSDPLPKQQTTLQP